MPYAGEFKLVSDNLACMNAQSKDRVLACLEKNKGEFISGAALAREIGLSRNSVWKAVRALIDAGYEIESVTGKGYMLKGSSSVLSSAAIECYLDSPDIHVEYHECIDSTNTQAKRLAEAGAPEGTLVVANEQSAGRGRQGRPFYSPGNTGIYFSLLLRPKFGMEGAALITSYAACCLADTIEKCTGQTASIKWVNDVFVDERKVSGILTEASFSAENMQLSYVVVGIGVNVMRPETGFSEDSDTIAGALSDLHADENDLRARLIAGTVNRFMEHYSEIPRKPHLDDYRKRSLLTGRHVQVFEGDEQFEADVLDINDDFTLRVRLGDGSERSLVSGDVHIPSSQFKELGTNASAGLSKEGE